MSPRAKRASAAAVVAAFVAACGGSTSTPSDAGALDGGADAPVDAAAEACVTSPPRPVDEASVQTVQIHARNATTEDRWLATKAPCGALALTGPSGPVLLTTTPPCGCTCTPAPAGTMTFVRVPAGTERVVSWDATELVPYPICLSCAARDVQTTVVDRRVAKPGSYSVALRAFAAAPCAGDGDTITCPGECPNGGVTTSVPFELAASGGADVSVDL